MTAGDQLQNHDGAPGRTQSAKPPDHISGPPLAPLCQRDVFEHRIVSKEDVLRGKPDPEPFDLGFRQLHLPDDQRLNVLAFEDDPLGVRSAQAAGLYAIILTTRYSADEIKEKCDPDIITDGYAEIGDALRLELVY